MGTSELDKEKLGSDSASSATSSSQGKKSSKGHQQPHNNPGDLEKGTSTEPKKSRGCQGDFVAIAIAIGVFWISFLFPPLGAWHVTRKPFGRDSLIACGLMVPLVLPSHIWVLYLEFTYYFRCIHCNFPPPYGWGIYSDRVLGADGRYKGYTPKHPEDGDGDGDEPNDGWPVRTLLAIGRFITKCLPCHKEEQKEEKIGDAEQAQQNQKPIA